MLKIFQGYQGYQGYQVIRVIRVIFIRVIRVIRVNSVYIGKSKHDSRATRKHQRQRPYKTPAWPKTPINKTPAPIVEQEFQSQRKTNFRLQQTHRCSSNFQHRPYTKRQNFFSQFFFFHFLVFQRKFYRDGFQRKHTDPPRPPIESTTYI